MNWHEQCYSFSFNTVATNSICVRENNLFVYHLIVSRALDTSKKILVFKCEVGDTLF